MKQICYKACRLWAVFSLLTALGAGFTGYGHANILDPSDIVNRNAKTDRSAMNNLPVEDVSSLERPLVPDTEIPIEALPEKDPESQAKVLLVAPDDPFAESLFRLFSEPKPHTPTAKVYAEKRTVKIREDVAAFYADNQYRALWLENTTLSKNARKLIAFIKLAHDDALNPADYLIPERIDGMRPDQLAEMDVALSMAFVRYAQDARGGRLEPFRLSRAITPTLELPDTLSVLTRLTTETEPEKVLAAYHPAHVGYLSLRKKLGEFRAETYPNGVPEAIKQIPEGANLKTGMNDVRVPLLRERLNIAAQEGEDLTLYSKDVAAAVSDFQRTYKLKSNGILTKTTLAALNAPPLKIQEGDLIANMERWRWLPSDLGSRHVVVNIPEYKLQYIDAGKIQREARVIVGKPASPTPVFSHKLQFLVVNPYWTIPPSILKGSVLPGLANDPNYAKRRGYQVSGRGRNIVVRQPPGPRNALGYIKFMFPNDHAVYLHDTPNRGLFSSHQRAISHGCVRVQEPFRLAELLLEKESSWTEAKLRSLIGKGERHITLKEPVAIHLTYFTTQVDDTGKMTQFGDLYGFHQRTKRALGL